MFLFLVLSTLIHSLGAPGITNEAIDDFTISISHLLLCVCKFYNFYIVTT